MYSEHIFLWPPEKVISVGVGQKKVTSHSLIITVTINATFAITFIIWVALGAMPLKSGQMKEVTSILLDVNGQCANVRDDVGQPTERHKERFHNEKLGVA